MQIRDFEPMSIGRILDRTFKIYKENFIRFITIVAIIQVPVALLMATSMSIFQKGALVKENDPNQWNAEQTPENSTSEYSQNDSTENNNNIMYIFSGIGMAIGGLLTMLGHVLCRGALIKSVSEFYLGNEITVGEAYKFILPKFLRLIGAGILVILAIYGGFILLVVPGIIFGLWFSLTTPAIVVEDLKVIKGMSRSKALVSGNLGKMFSIGFLIIGNRSQL